MGRGKLRWVPTIAIAVLACVTAGCSNDAYRAVTVAQLTRDRDTYQGQRIRVAGTVVREPDWNGTGAVFWIEDVTGATVPVRVVYGGKRPPTPNAEATATGSWVGAVVLFRGTFDGGLVRSNSLIIRQDGPYRATPAWSTSAAVRAAEQAHPADFGTR